jgi:hypothetical protein
MFYVYIDYRLDGRPFYIGKGKEGRLTDMRRNKYHRAIVKKHGLLRKVVWSGEDEQCAFFIERRLIGSLKDSHTLANMTDGGEGVSGYTHTLEHKQHVSNLNRERYAKGTNAFCNQEKRLKDRTHNWVKHEYHFMHPIHGDRVCLQSELIREFTHLRSNLLSAMCSGKRNHHGGWRLASTA